MQGVAFSSRSRSCAQLGANLLGCAAVPFCLDRMVEGRRANLLVYCVSVARFQSRFQSFKSLPMSNPAAPHPASMRMTPAERRATASLASIYGLRLLGMFVILPVFALYAKDSSRRREPHADRHRARRLRAHAGDPADTVRLGLRQMGTQAGDLHGARPFRRRQLRRRVGAVASAGSSSGRCLQGAGAISAAVIALTADLTRDGVRTRAMAAIGITIALTFAASLIAGPVLKAWIGVPGIFALTGVLARCGDRRGPLRGARSRPRSGRARTSLRVSSCA